MTQEQLLGIVRSILIIGGTFLFGHNLFGNKIDESLWQEIVGGILVAVSFVWSFLNKQLTIEIFQTSILKIVTVAGTLLVASGKLSDTTWQAIVGLVTTILPLLYSILSKQKSAAIVSGKIDATQLAK